MRIGMITPFGVQSQAKEAERKENFLPAAKPLPFDTVSFGHTTIDNEYKNKYQKCSKKFTPEAENLWNHAKSIAHNNGETKLSENHLFLASLIDIRKRISELDAGADAGALPNFLLPTAVEELTIEGSMHDKLKRAKLTPVIEKYIKETKKELARERKEGQGGHLKRKEFFKLSSGGRFNPSAIKPSNYLMYDVVTMNNVIGNADDKQPTSYTDGMLFQSLSLSRNKNFGEKMREFQNDMLSVLMVDDVGNKDDVHLKFYDEKAGKLWRNLDLERDMFVLYDDDNKTAAKHIITSFVKLMDENATGCKKLNKDNTNIVVMNKEVDFDFILEQARRAKNDKSKTHIFIIPFFESVRNTAIGRQLQVLALEAVDTELIRNQKVEGDADIRFVFVTSKGVYFNNQNGSENLKTAIENYGQISIPMVNQEDAKQMLKDKSGKTLIRNAVKKEFSDDAIDLIVEVSNSLEGHYPEKAISFMASVASYHVDKKEIGINDVQTFIEETRDVSKANEKDSEFQISFDTGKKLDDIVGSAMTRAEAKSVVDQIRNKTATTKGMTVFLDNGTSYGGGRKHTAEAIAGEAGIPMITINARDFALKDIDALSQNADLSELKIKKLMSLAKSQAEANKNKTAMIYIENFDNFGCYGYSSIYEQKAFSQLLLEMENIRKNDNINLLIVGSTNDPENLDVDIMKPYKFLDRIIIYSPQDSNDRTDILNYYIKKNGLKIAGETEEERAAIVKNISETTAYFTVVDLMYLLDKANCVSKEQGKDAIDKNDFVEAFLQTTTGRVSTREQPEHDKEIVAAHECGHGLTLQIMYDLAKKAEKPWHLPDQLNFITLDPRGRYGGSMYPKNSKNDEYSFEKMFADIVCSYGGHSSEKEFYNMEGSWGITQDMRDATATARLAVESMGLGAKTGRIAIDRNIFGLSDIPERVKNEVYDDMLVILKNANLVSDKIVHAYAPFVQEFAEKYKDRVGTGDCVVSADEFNEELKAWREKQPEDVQAELKALENEILDIIKTTKKGECAKSTKL